MTSLRNPHVGRRSPHRQPLRSCNFCFVLCWLVGPIVCITSAMYVYGPPVFELNSQPFVLPFVSPWRRHHRKDVLARSSGRSMCSSALWRQIAMARLASSVVHLRRPSTEFIIISRILQGIGRRTSKQISSQKTSMWNGMMITRMCHRHRHRHNEHASRLVVHRHHSSRLQHRHH